MRTMIAAGVALMMVSTATGPRVTPEQRKAVGR